MIENIFKEVLQESKMSPSDYIRDNLHGNSSYDDLINDLEEFYGFDYERASKLLDKIKKQDLKEIEKNVFGGHPDNNDGPYWDQLQESERKNMFGLKPGQWPDDESDYWDDKGIDDGSAADAMMDDDDPIDKDPFDGNKWFGGGIGENPDNYTDDEYWDIIEKRGKNDVQSIKDQFPPIDLDGDRDWLGLDREGRDSEGRSWNGDKNEWVKDDYNIGDIQSIDDDFYDILENQYNGDLAGNEDAIRDHLEDRGYDLDSIEDYFDRLENGDDDDEGAFDD
jgi:hypothetical protein